MVETLDVGTTECAGGRMERELDGQKVFRRNICRVVIEGFEGPFA